VNIKQTYSRLKQTIAGRAYQAMQELSRKIVKRTQAGISVEGLKFKPYSAKYADKRAESGRNTTVDLTLSGGMLQAVQTKDPVITSKGTSIKIYIANIATKDPFSKKFVSAVEKVKKTNKYRRWFGVSKQEREDLIRKIKGR